MTTQTVIRAGVLVQSEGLSYHEPCVLLCHYNGSPEYLIPIMLNYETIFENEVKKVFQNDMMHDKRWMLGRALHLTSLIIATDSLLFEVHGFFEKEEDVIFQSHVDYYYVITTKNYQKGAITEIPQVFIEIYTTLTLDKETLIKFWQTKSPKLLKQLLPLTPFTQKAIKRFLRKFESPLASIK
jgi:hypothetical protein